MASSRVIRCAAIGFAFLMLCAMPVQGELILTQGSNIVFLNDNGTFNHQFSLGSATQGVVANPISNGNFYVATSANTVIEFNAYGNTQLASTSGGVSPLDVNDPRGLARDAAGNIYVANAGNGNVLRFNSALGGEIQYGSLSLISPGAKPTALVVDGAGTAFVTAINSLSGLGQLFSITSGGTVTVLNGNLVGATVTNADLGIAFRPSNGDLLIAVNNTVREYTTAGAFVSTFASDATAANNMVSPIGVGFGLDGNFYVANTAGSGTNGNNILQFPAGGGTTGTNFFQISGPRFITFAAPEPASLTLVALGSAAGFLGYWRRRKTHAQEADSTVAPEKAPAA